MGDLTKGPPYPCPCPPQNNQQSRPGRQYCNTSEASQDSPVFLHTNNAASIMTSTPTSQASTKVDSDASANGDVHNKSFKRRAVELARESATAQDIFLFLIALRILNALSIRTYFQPDEYFQSLEPAWRMAFGGGSGAWITWVGLSALSM